MDGYGRLLRLPRSCLIDALPDNHPGTRPRSSLWRGQNIISFNLSSGALRQLPPANHHFSGRRRNDAISEVSIHGTLVDVLDVVIQSDISDHLLELVSYEPTAGTAKHEHGRKLQIDD